MDHVSQNHNEGTLLNVLLLYYPQGFWLALRHLWFATEYADCIDQS